MKAKSMAGTLRRRAHTVVPYRDEWPELYAREAEVIKRTLGDELLYIEHAGSTAIKGFGGNAVIDVVAIVRDLKRIPLYTAALRVAGYHQVLPCPVVDALFFRKEGPGKDGEWEHVADLHIFPDEHPRMVDMIDIRDYLRAHPDEARKYEEANRKLSEKHDFEKYMEKKSEYLHGLSRRAAKWRGREVEEEYGLM